MCVRAVHLHGGLYVCVGAYRCARHGGAAPPSPAVPPATPQGGRAAGPASEDHTGLLL